VTFSRVCTLASSRTSASRNLVRQPAKQDDAQVQGLQARAAPYGVRGLGQEGPHGCRGRSAVPVRAQGQVNGRERRQAGQQGRKPPGVQVGGRPVRIPFLTDIQALDALDSADLRAEPPLGAASGWRTGGRHGVLAARIRKGLNWRYVDAVETREPSRWGAHFCTVLLRNTGTITLFGYARMGRTGASKRSPQPVSEVTLQRAPEGLLERLLEAPAACAKHQACYCRLLACPIAEQQTARTCTLSAARKLVSRLEIYATSPPWQGGPRMPVRPAETRHHTLKARRYPCALSAAAPAQQAGRTLPCTHLCGELVQA